MSANNAHADCYREFIPSNAIMHLRVVLCFGWALTIARSLQLRPDPSSLSRRNLIAQSIQATVSASVIASPAHALIKGNAAPTAEEKLARKRDRERAKSLTEAELEGERRELLMKNKAEADELLLGQEVAFRTTPTGVRYRDLAVGTGSAVAKGSVVEMRYRVLKQGKRSPDGVSGVGTLLFSLGYGEDDDKEGSSLTVKLGENKLIAALEEGVPGMQVGGKRRILVVPSNGKGWKKLNEKDCSTLFDVGLASGIPGAVITKVEDCIDLNLEPRPVSYGARRRMARRFDESLVAEIEIVAVK